MLPLGRLALLKFAVLHSDDDARGRHLERAAEVVGPVFGKLILKNSAKHSKHFD